MNKLIVEEFFEKFMVYSKSFSKVASIEKALQEIKQENNLSDKEVNEIREHILDLMEYDE